MQVAPAGDNAVLVDLGEVSAGELHAAAREARNQPGVLACIPGHSSLYVVFERAGAVPAFVPPAAFRELSSARPDGSERPIAVTFDGPDLEEFLKHTGLTPGEFLERVPSLRLTARYLGFRGGFAYLDGWPAEWAMPRRPTSRPLVRRGTFAIAGNVAGFYPIDSPGGWNLLGHTSEHLEHALAAGDVVRLVPSSGTPASSPAEQGASPLPGQNLFEVITAPLMTRVHAPDWTRVERGYPPGGPFDDIAAAMATRAVTGCETLLECAMTGPRLRFLADATAAWCGPDLDVRLHRLRKGEELAIGRITGGLRGYLAIGNGEGAIVHAERDDRHVIRALQGPHDQGPLEVECVVSSRLDRVGVRLQPLQPLSIAAPADLRSCGMQCGTVQLHPDGSLVAMGPDHPITGGYLQPMTVPTTERWKLGQLMPGERVVLRVARPSP